MYLLFRRRWSLSCPRALSKRAPRADSLKYLLMKHLSEHEFGKGARRLHNRLRLVMKAEREKFAAEHYQRIKECRVVFDHGKGLCCANICLSLWFPAPAREEACLLEWPYGSRHRSPPPSSMLERCRHRHLTPRLWTPAQVTVRAGYSLISVTGLLTFSHSISS